MALTSVNFWYLSGSVYCFDDNCWSLAFGVPAALMVVAVSESITKFRDSNYFKTRMHSSRMRSARSLTRGGVPARGVYLPGGVPARGEVPAQGGVPAQGVYLPGGVPCDLSHHAFDVTCMLPPHQLRPINSAAANILLVDQVTCKACWDTTSPPVDRIFDTRF